MIAGVRLSEHKIASALFIFRAPKTNRHESEKAMDPVSVMFWNQLIDLLGSISDQVENVADRLLRFI